MSRNANLRDTEDGINEAGWEAEMAKPIEQNPGTCDECGFKRPHLTELHIDNGENGSLWLCRWCYEKATETGSCDPENRDWDAERELREFEGDL